jgi:hypothetical protein
MAMARSNIGFCGLSSADFSDPDGLRASEILQKQA